MVLGHGVRARADRPDLPRQKKGLESPPMEFPPRRVKSQVLTGGHGWDQETGAVQNRAEQSRGIGNQRKEERSGWAEVE